jgi:hypothetical protein
MVVGICLSRSLCRGLWRLARGAAEIYAANGLMSQKASRFRRSQ